MKRLTLPSIRFWLFTALLVLAPLSKYPSVATPLFNFTSFRIGLYQIVLLLFVIASTKPTLLHLKNFRRQRAAGFWSVVGLALLCIVSLITALDKPRSGLLVASILLLLFGVVASWWYVAYELPKKRYGFLVKTILIAGCVYGVFSILQFVLAGFAHQTLGLLCTGCGSQVFGFPRINGFAAEPQFHANAMLLYFFMGLGVFYYSRSRLALVSCLLSLGAVGLTLSRGAFLAAFVGVAVFYALLKLQGKIRLKTIALHLGSVFIIALLVAGLFVGASAYRYRSTPDIAYKTFRSLVEQTSLGVIKLPAHTTSGFVPAGLVQASAGDRLSAAHLAVRAWKYSPFTFLFGVGSGNLGPFVNKHIDANAPSNLTVYIYYVLVVAELGLLGLISLVVLFASVIKHLLKSYWRRADAAPYMALVGLMTAFLVQYCFFGSYINVSYIWIIAGALLGLSPHKSGKSAII